MFPTCFLDTPNQRFWRQKQKKAKNIFSDEHLTLSYLPSGGGWYSPMLDQHLGKNDRLLILGENWKIVDLDQSWLLPCWCVCWPLSGQLGDCPRLSKLVRNMFYHTVTKISYHTVTRLSYLTITKSYHTINKLVRNILSYRHLINL